MNVKIFKKKWSQLKWFQDENWNILEEAFATDFWKNGYTYYKHFTYSGTTDYHMGYCDIENGKKLTEPFAHYIFWVFAYDREWKRDTPNNRFIKIYNPETWECLNNDFADKVIPTSVYSDAYSTPLSNTSLVDHRLDENISDTILIRFKKDEKIGLVDQNGNIVVEPFAKNIDVDWVFNTEDSLWIINLLTWDIELLLDNSYDDINIYQPDLKKWQKEYLIKLWKSDYKELIWTHFKYNSDYLDVMLYLLSLKIK